MKRAYSTSLLDQMASSLEEQARAAEEPEPGFGFYQNEQPHSTMSLDDLHVRRGSTGDRPTRILT